MDYAAQIAIAVVFGIGFGLAATVPPGPINTQIARRTLKFGFLPGLAFGAGSIFIENSLAIAAALGFRGSISDHPLLMKLTLFVGFVVLTIVGAFAVFSGYRAWQNPIASQHAIDTNPHAAHGERRASPAPTKTQLVTMPRSFFAGVGMAIVSPYTILFWIVGLPSVAQEYLDEFLYGWPLLIGIFAGTSIWIFGYTSMIAWLKRYKSTGIWADLVGGTLLLIFAGLALLRLAELVLHGTHPHTSTTLINGGHFP